MKLSRRSFLSLLVAAPAVSVFETLPVAKTTPRPYTPSYRSKHIERYIIAIGSQGLIGVGQWRILEAMPQRPFRPEKFMTPPGQGFTLLGIATTGEPEPLFAQFVPADAFSPHAFGSFLTFAPVRPGETILLGVRNDGEVPRQFSGALLGTVIQ